MSGRGQPAQSRQARSETSRIMAVLPRFACLVYLFFCASLLDTVSVDFDSLYLAFIPGIKDGWIFLVLTPLAPYLQRIFVKSALILQRFIVGVGVSDACRQRYLFTYAYLSPFLIVSALDRWRYRPAA